MDRARRVIPSLLLDSRGRLVEPFRADGVDRVDVLSVAASLVETGAREIFLNADQVAGTQLVELCCSLSEATAVPFTVARDLTDPGLFERLLEAGAQRVAICRTALSDPDLISKLARRATPGSLTLVIATRREGDAWRVLAGAGGDATEWDAVTWARVTEAQGAGELIVQTPKDRGSDDLNRLASLRQAVGLPVIAGGEPQTSEDLFDLLMIGDTDGVLIGAPLVSGRSALREIREFLSAHGLAAE